MARRLKTFPALASVRMPSTAVIVAAHPRPDANQAPALLVEYDDADETTTERHFMQVHPGGPIPTPGGFIHSWRQSDDPYGPIVALYEQYETGVPDNLPRDVWPEYRLLVADGFEPVQRHGAPNPSWKAPADRTGGTLSLEQMRAVATLQEYGYGPVVD